MKRWLLRVPTFDRADGVEIEDVYVHIRGLVRTIQSPERRFRLRVRGELIVNL